MPKRRKSFFFAIPYPLDIFFRSLKCTLRKDCNPKWYIWISIPRWRNYKIKHKTKQRSQKILWDIRHKTLENKLQSKNSWWQNVALKYEKNIFQWLSFFFFWERKEDSCLWVKFKIHVILSIWRWKDRAKRGENKMNGVVKTETERRKTRKRKTLMR